MFKVGDLAVVADPVPGATAWPGAVEGDVVQITSLYTGFVGFTLLRTGENTPEAWSSYRLKPLPLTPSNKDNDHEPTSR